MTDGASRTVIRFFRANSPLHRVAQLTVKRRSSTSQRHWSTPLARTIADAIKVRSLTGPFFFASGQDLDTDAWIKINPDYRPDIYRGVHATMPHGSARRILHFAWKGVRDRAVWEQRGLYHVAGDNANIRGVTSNLDGYRMDGSREEDQWRAAD